MKKIVLFIIFSSLLTVCIAMYMPNNLVLAAGTSTANVLLPQSSLALTSTAVNFGSFLKPAERSSILLSVNPTVTRSAGTGNVVFVGTDFSAGGLKVTGASPAEGLTFVVPNLVLLTVADDGDAGSSNNMEYFVSVAYQVGPQFYEHYPLSGGTRELPFVADDNGSVVVSLYGELWIDDNQQVGAYSGPFDITVMQQ